MMRLKCPRPFDLSQARTSIYEFLWGQARVFFVAKLQGPASKGMWCETLIRVFVRRRDTEGNGVLWPACSEAGLAGRARRHRRPSMSTLNRSTAGTK